MALGMADRRVLVMGLLGILMVVMLPLKAQPIAWEGIEDPNIRAAQFDLLMGDSFAAITQLKADQQQGRIKHRPAQAQFALGGMYLAYGAHRTAAEIFQTLGESRQPQQLRDLAWYQLARVQYQRGLKEEAMAALGHIVGELPAESQQERLLLMSMLLMQNQRHAEAVTYLRQLGTQSLLRQLGEKSVWATYGRFNLGVALYRQGREQEGQKLLEELGVMEVQNEEDKALRDKANLTLAYFFLAKNDPQRAQRYFVKTRLEGPMSNKALLGLGRAYSATGQYKKSLSPWLTLIKRDASDPVVQDALLAAPFAFGKLNALKQALEHYQLALETYQGELEQLKKAELAVSSGAMIDKLARAFNNQGMEAQAVLTGLADAGASRYLWPLFATYEFQETLKNYARMRLSLGRLDEWLSQVDNSKKVALSQQPDLEIRIVRLQAKLVEMVERVRDYLRVLALNELEQRKQRLVNYAGEARFSMAQIYDYAAKRWGVNDE